jgi:hypothetical protein
MRQVSYVPSGGDEGFPLLRQKTSSLFMLLGWNSISVTSQIRFMNVDVVEMILIFWR